MKADGSFIHHLCEFHKKSWGRTKLITCPASRCSSKGQMKFKTDNLLFLKNGMRKISA